MRSKRALLAFLLLASLATAGLAQSDADIQAMKVDGEVQTRSFEMKINPNETYTREETDAKKEAWMEMAKYDQMSRWRPRDSSLQLESLTQPHRTMSALRVGDMRSPMRNELLLRTSS